MRNAALAGAAFQDWTDDRVSSVPEDSDTATHRPIERWADRCIALAIAVSHGEANKQASVDELQDMAERNGLIAEWGQDEIQACLSLVFSAVWAPKGETDADVH
jgi:hypothetical protein